MGRVSQLHCAQLILTCLILFVPTFVDAESSISLDALPAYTVLRECARECLYCPKCLFVMDVGSKIGCGENGDPPYFDSCFCRSDLAPSASSYLTSCIRRSCSSQPADITSAVSIYDDYCSFDREAVPTATPTTTARDRGASPAATSMIISSARSTARVTTTSSADPPRVTNGGDTTSAANSSPETSPAKTSSVRPTEGQSPASSTNLDTKTGADSDNGMSLSNRIALGCGLGLGIPTLIATVWLCFTAERRRKNKQEPEGGVQTVHEIAGRPRWG